MYLSLCLECSKDYIELRNNPSIWNDFIKEIEGTDIVDQSTIEVGMGNRTIMFTAIHLAEIQEILKVESEDTRDYSEDNIDVIK